MSELLNIQQTLKAPKGQTNAFGKYKYRSCEDILEALKAPLAANGCYVVIQDDIVMVGDRIYVKSIVELKKDGKTLESATAFARESLSKKGMDDSQITGATSSYSRKYALNGLFAIDDTKDADTLAPPVQEIDISAERALIASCSEIDQLVEVWKEINDKYKGKKMPLEISKLKDAKKSQLFGEG